MSNPTSAEEEFQAFLAKNSDDPTTVHPEDRDSSSQDSSEPDEDDTYRAGRIDAAMRMSTTNSSFAVGPTGGDLKLPPPTFDNGWSTGVKGVIADARSYENAKRGKWKDRVNAARRSMFSLESFVSDRSSGADSDISGEDHEEQNFLQQWRETRLRELESEGAAPIRTRRTSPSVRLWGRMDEVDALGYLDAIEKVGRDTVVCVFVYDHECQVSATVEAALRPLVGAYPTVHFVKVHYDDIEFDNAAVPAILAYKNQGDLFANLTGMIDMIPDNEYLDPRSLQQLFSKHGIL